MKKLKKLKKPKLPKSLRRPLEATGKLTSQTADKLTGKPSASSEEKITDALSNVPQITNETVSDHREEVLSSARKYIYPLQHSKHHVVRISLSLLTLVLVVFFTYTGLSLYKFQSTSTFLYNVTKILPFPVAKADDSWISYESYLFELRRNIHYYETQQLNDFSTKEYKPQLDRLKKQAMDKVIEDAYVKTLAEKNNVTVSNQAVTDHLAVVRSQNRLGNNDRVFREVLNEFWGWNEADFRRELKQQLLAQAVVAKLDTDTKYRAALALKQLQGGADFAAIAAKDSDDPVTKATGGQYPAAISISDREVSPLITSAIAKLKPGQISNIINTGYTLEILKVLDNTSGIKAAHIQFNLKPITTYTKPLQKDNPPSRYIKT